MCKIVWSCVQIYGVLRDILYAVNSVWMSQWFWTQHVHECVKYFIADRNKESSHKKWQCKSDFIVWTESQFNLCVPLMFFFSKMIKFRPPDPFYLVNPVGLEIRPLCMIGELSLGRNPTVRKEQKRVKWSERQCLTGHETVYLILADAPFSIYCQRKPAFSGFIRCDVSVLHCEVVERRLQWY